MSVLDTPVRHEFYDADKPSHPLWLGTKTYDVVRTEVQRRYIGLETEEIVIKYYIDLK